MAQQIQISGRNKLYEKILLFVDKLAAALLLKMVEENEALLMENVCSPLKQEWAKEKICKKMLESHLNCCKLEQELQAHDESVDITSTSNTSSDDGVSNELPTSSVEAHLPAGCRRSSV
jgi:hypothetical protein